jgi:ABC-2 type transport system permease protein
VRGLQGTGALVRVALRRDRLLLPAWISVLVLMVSTAASATVGLYPTVASRVQAAEAINRAPSLVALYGRIDDPTSLGAVAMLKLVVLGAAMVGLLAAIVTIRHTRAEEETGRLELLGGTVVGRKAPLTAALAVAVGTSLSVGMLSAVGLAAAGLPVGSSFAFGAGWASVGIAFAAIAAVAAQLARTARNATGLTIGVLGLAYVFRAIGDTSDGLAWLSWASPLGWMQHIRAFTSDRWPVLFVFAAFAVVAIAAAFVLGARRDLGSGLLSDRPGPALAGPRLHSAPGLAWRLERGTLVVWASAFAVLGLVVGSVASDVSSIVTSPESRDLIRRLGGEKGLVDAFLAAELSVLGLIIAAYGVHAALRLRSEEASHRAEAVLATAVGRWQFAGSSVMVAMLGTTCLAVISGLAVGAANAMQTGHAGDLFGVLGGALVQLPAVWVVIGIVVAAFGVAPRLAVLGWVALVFFLLLGEFGPLLELPRSVIDLSPFAHVPRLPGSPLRAEPIAALVGISVMLIGAGLVGFRRRDIA